MSGGEAFSQDRVYHSYLKSASPIVVRFTSDVRESDYDGYIRYFEVRGDDYDGYYHQIENEQTRRYLEEEVPTGEWVKIVASGDGREGTASLEAHAAEGPDTEYSTPSDADDMDEQYGPRIGPDAILDQYALVVEKAKDRFPWITDDEGRVTELGGRVINTLYIGWTSTTGRRAPLYEGQGEDMADPVQADRIEEDLETLSWDGTSHDGRDLENMKVRLSTLAEGIREGEITQDVANDSIAWLNNEIDAQGEDPVGSDLGDDDLPF